MPRYQSLQRHFGAKRNGDKLRHNIYWFAGIGIAWMIGKSLHLVEAED